MNIYLEKCKTTGGHLDRDDIGADIGITGYRRPRLFSHWVHEVPIEETRRDKEQRTQLTPYRHGATALTDRLTRNSSWSTARWPRGGEVTRAALSTLSHTISCPCLIAYVLFVPLTIFALRHHLVVNRRTLVIARARVYSTPVANGREGTKRARETGKERGVANGAWGGQSRPVYGGEVAKYVVEMGWRMNAVACRLAILLIFFPPFRCVYTRGSLN